MAIVFPISPSVNDTFTSGSITYKWDGQKWIGLGVTPSDKLIEGSNSLEITAGNDLVWTGDAVGLGTPTPDPACKLEVKGTSDGVLHLNTTDARGSFIRFQENDTTKAWVGCAEGLITGTDQDDLGLRATDNIVFRAGSAESARIRGQGPHLLLGTGGDTSYNEITETSSNAGLVIGSGSVGNGGLVIRTSNTGTGRIYFADNSGGDAGRNIGFINYYHSDDTMRFQAGGNERLRILGTGGDVNVLTGNLVIGTSGKGIDFSASGNAAGMTSELLNDYEEGTWTPNIDNAYFTTPGTSYNSRAGKYVKIGKMVLARFFMNIGGVTNSGVGPLFFGGLPFVHDTSDISHRGLQASLYISGPNTPTGAVNVNLGYATLDNGNYYLTLSTPIDDLASNNGRVIQAADLSNGDVISGTIMYIST